MSKHSPSPWKWLPEGETDRLVDAEGYDVIYPQEYGMDVDEIDAALIARACEIPELEARVKELREALEGMVNVFEQVYGADEQEVEEYVRAEAALAKEKEKS